MPRRNRRYPAELRDQLVEMVRAGRSPEDLGREYEPSAAVIRLWVKQADLDDGRRKDGLTSAEREEIQRLRREVRQLKLERDILKKAAAWFARETDSIPPKDSNS
jgi:transposase